MNERIAPHPISAENAEEYTAALAQVFSGGWRLIHHAQREGYPHALGMTTEEWVTERLGGYVRLAIPERREIVKELIEEGLTQRDVAAVVGVDEKTVRNDRVASAEFSAPGDKKPRGNAKPPMASAENSAPSEVRSETPPPYDAAPPLLSIVDLETGRIVPEPDSDAWPEAIPDIRQTSDEERTFDQLTRMSTITRMSPAAVADAAVRHRTSSARDYLDRAETILAWHTELVAALRTRIDAPIRAIK